MPSACAPPQEARFHGSDGIAHYEFEWDFSATQPKTNPNGTTGFARVISRSSGGDGLNVGYLCRVHRCEWIPCCADYPPSKYGHVGPPLHIRPSDWKPPADADAEAASKPPPAAPPEPPAEAPPKEPPPAAPPKEPPPAAPPEPPPEPPPAAPPEPPAGPPALPGPPARQPLRQTSAAEPLATAVQPPRQAGAAVAAVAAQEPAAPFAEGQIMSRLLELAREIRRPRAYTGYSFFLCFALARGCRPFAWQGKDRI